MVMSPEIIAQVYKVSKEISPAVLNSILNILGKHEGQLFSSGIKNAILNEIPTINSRHTVTSLLNTCEVEGESISCGMISVALSTAKFCSDASQKENKSELVWTGPNTSGIPFRRTEQALLELIQEATDSLILVSFAIYEIPEIAQELIKAVDRGVKLTIIAETPKASVNKIGYETLEAFPEYLLSKAKVYIWPLDKRIKNAAGKYGSLHVKCAVADGHTLFITSANLTAYALCLNMEMGVILCNTKIALQVEYHFKGLIIGGTLVLLDPTSSC
jgi:phosphatidylserine/phosphatidylglycerophosphate/cardiolipin synthase-like enzyme